MSSVTANIPTDRLLLTQLAKDYSWALEPLMRRYESRIYNFVLKLLKSAELAEEITQDVFIKLWESRAEVVNVDSLPAWLYTVSRNRSLNVLKECTARHLREKNYTSRLALNVDGEGEMIYRNLREVMADFVNTLPPKRKEIFRLKTEQGLTREEIGQQLSISPHTVKNQLSRSYFVLRRLMQESIYCCCWICMITIY